MAEQKRNADKTLTLKEAIRGSIHDGCSLTLGGFCGRNSQAAAHEIVRQHKRNLTIIDDSPTDQLDIMIGAGCVKAVEIAWIGVSIFSLARNFRRSTEEAIPHRIEVEDYSNYAAGLRFLAGAMNVPFMPTRSLLGSDIPRHNQKIKIIDDPYERRPIALVPAASPDVAIIHVQRADTRGNCQIWGHLANDENKPRAAKRTIITCEEIVPEETILRIPNMISIPSYCVDAVVQVPYASHPWSCYGYYHHDVMFQRDYAQLNKSRDGFMRWLGEWVLGCKDHADYSSKVGEGRLSELAETERSINKIPV